MSTDSNTIAMLQTTPRLAVVDVAFCKELYQTNKVYTGIQLVWLYI